MPGETGERIRKVKVGKLQGLKTVWYGKQKPHMPAEHNKEFIHHFPWTGRCKASRKAGLHPNFLGKQTTLSWMSAPSSFSTHFYMLSMASYVTVNLFGQWRLAVPAVSPPYFLCSLRQTTLLRLVQEAEKPLNLLALLRSNKNLPALSAPFSVQIWNSPIPALSQNQNNCVCCRWSRIFNRSVHLYLWRNYMFWNG